MACSSTLVACYIKVVDEYIFRLQSSISFYGVKVQPFVSQTRKNVDKYKNVVSSYIKVVDEYILRLQSSISFYGV